MNYLRDTITNSPAPEFTAINHILEIQIICVNHEQGLSWKDVTEDQARSHNMHVLQTTALKFWGVLLFLFSTSLNTVGGELALGCNQIQVDGRAVVFQT